MPAAPILITTAVTAEAAPLIARLGLARDMTVLDDAIVHTGARNNRPIVVMTTGIGPERAARLTRQAIERCRPVAVIIGGFAGATNPNLRLGDVVVPVIVEDEKSGKRYQPTIFADGLGLLRTVARLVTSPADKALHFNNGADAVDMETAAMAAVCEELGAAWLCVRSVSDTAVDPLPAYLLKLTRPDGRPDLRAAVTLALTRPTAIGPLLRLGKAAKLAAGSLADRVVQLLPRFPV